MNTNTLLGTDPVISGPHLDQAARDLLEDIGIHCGEDLAGFGDAMYARAVTAS